MRRAEGHLTTKETTRARASDTDEWMALSDALLGGMVHAVNNRLTALSVAVELATLGDQKMLSDGVLSAEMKRLQRTCGLVGLLPARGAEAEALELGPVLEDAITLHAQHPRVRNVNCVVECETSLPPVRAPRWALLRLLLLLLDAAKGAALDATESRVAIRLSGDEDSLSMRATVPGELTPYAATMAELCGAAITREAGVLVLTLPSLLEVRRRERAMRAAV